MGTNMRIMNGRPTRARRHSRRPGLGPPHIRHPHHTRHQSSRTRHHGRRPSVHCPLIGLINSGPTRNRARRPNRPSGRPNHRHHFIRERRGMTLRRQRRGQITHVNHRIRTRPNRRRPRRDQRHRRTTGQPVCTFLQGLRTFHHSTLKFLSRRRRCHRRRPQRHDSRGQHTPAIRNLSRPASNRGHRRRPRERPGRRGPRHPHATIDKRRVTSRQINN